MGQSTSSAITHNIHPPLQAHPMAASQPDSPSQAFLDNLLVLLKSYDAKDATLTFVPPSNPKEAAIQQAIAELANRLYVAESVLPPDKSGSSFSGSGGPQSLDWKNAGGPAAPDFTPPIHPVTATKPPHPSYLCTTCGRAPIADVFMERFGSASPVILTSGAYTAPPENDTGDLSAAEELQLLKAQVQDVARVCKAVASGDLTKKITADVQGVAMVQLKTIINTMVDRLAEFTSEVIRVSDQVGTQGILGGQAVVVDLEGTWRELTASVNNLSANITTQVRAIAEVTKSVTRGDLNKKIEFEARGEILELQNTVNGMVIRLKTLADEVARVALEVGVQGRLGGRAFVPDVEGQWKTMTDNVNMMAANLTDQVRSIADVTVAVARGDLSKQIGIEVEGEMAALKDTVNSMVIQLRERELLCWLAA